MARWIVAWLAVSTFSNLITSTVAGQSYLVGQLAMMLFFGAVGLTVLAVLWAMGLC